MKFRSIFFLLISLVLWSCNGQTSKNIKTISPQEYAEKIKKTPKAQILDVRTPEEYASGHIQNADNIDIQNNSFESKTHKYDKNKPVFVYCKVGGRGDKAAKKLEAQGFTAIYNLEGGILNWESAGLLKQKTKTSK